MGVFVRASSNAEPGQLITQAGIDGDWKTATLMEPLAYWSSKYLRIIKVPAGYKTDYFTVRRFMWWVFPRDGRGKRAAVIHDYIYTDKTHRFTRQQADAIFYEALRDCGVNAFSAYTMWVGVRIGGRGNW